MLRRSFLAMIGSCLFPWKSVSAASGFQHRTVSFKTRRLLHWKGCDIETIRREETRLIEMYMQLLKMRSGFHTVRNRDGIDITNSVIKLFERDISVWRDYLIEAKLRNAEMKLIVSSLQT
jgi:hypothetical protein